MQNAVFAQINEHIKNNISTIGIQANTAIQKTVKQLERDLTNEEANKDLNKKLLKSIDSNLKCLLGKQENKVELDVGGCYFSVR